MNSKEYKQEFWGMFGWGLAWLGFFGGIALLVWVVSKPDAAQIACFKQHGQWVLKDSNDYGQYGYYTCNFKGANK